MKLLSHGPGSDLLEHIRETIRSARSLQERVVLACHDIGKATVRWQKYIQAPAGHESPHPHAAAGGLLAASVLKNINADKKEILAALHCNAGHHSALGILNATLMKDLELIAAEGQPRQFFLDRNCGIASLLPEIPDDVLKRSWLDFTALANPLSSERETLSCELAAISGSDRLKAYLLAREWLGHLCYNDRTSAAKQDGKTGVLPDYFTAFSPRPFQPRAEKKLATGNNPIFPLRTSLRESFLQLVENDGIFSFIDAPTGMGKTETMIRAAEKIRHKIGAGRIIYAVPQVSVADQIFDDYFKNAPSSQIWNYRRKENTQKDHGQEENNGSDIGMLSAEAYPFEQSFNVTTFNQVLLAMLHPDRARCICMEGLKDSVIIMDEFHKLPMNILPLFFPAAREFAKKQNCRFILGSATPFRMLPYWDLTDALHLSPEQTDPLYHAPQINGRRKYRKLGELTIDALQEQIEHFHHENPDASLLVVVNLVADASWCLRKSLFGTYQPWRDLELEKKKAGRKIFV